ncbi:MAG: hypothetical protein NZM11_03125 [Anaerolineales bacterium]|nr:hypothetical protein [Anaerolineales bacterium]
MRDAATKVEAFGGQFESVADLLRREWDALSRANDFLAESVVAPACQRAFAELARSQQICAELACALRLTADTLEDADRRAAAICLRRDGNQDASPSLPLPWSGGNGPGGSSGRGGGGFGGDEEGGSLAEILQDAFRRNKLAITIALLADSELVWKGKDSRRYLSFSIADGLISPRALGILGGVAKNPADFVARVREVDLAVIGRPFGVIEKGLPLVGVAESLAKGEPQAVLPHIAAFGLQFVKRGEFLTDIPMGVYEALTDPKYQDAREAAVIVKGLAPVVSTAAGMAVGTLAGIAVGAALTAICPVGAPLWCTIAATAKLVTSYIVEQAVEQLIEQHEGEIIRFIDPTVDSFKSNLEAITQQVTDRVLQAGEEWMRNIAQQADAFADFFSSARHR